MAFAAIQKEPETKIDFPAPANIEIGDFNLTVHKAGDALGLDRRTVKKRLLSADITPVGKTINGYNLYFLGDVARACFANEAKTPGYKVANLQPKERAEHFMSVKRELEVLEKKRELIPYDQASEAFSELGRSFSKFFETFIDDLEQTQLFSVEQLQEMQILCDDQRRTFAQAEF